MADKRSLQPEVCQSQKRAKIYYVTQDDEVVQQFEDDNILQPGRHPTAPGFETETSACEESPAVAFAAASDANSPCTQQGLELTDGSADFTDLLTMGDPVEKDVAEDSELDETEQHTTPEEVDLEQELGPWSAPPEALRPRNPYSKGMELILRRHTANPPYGQGYADYPGLREYADERDLRTKTLVELCLEHSPMEGKTAWDDPPRSLRIVDVIRAKDDGGAQLVICQLDDAPEEYVAKIYDPLYYGFSDRMWSDQPRDVTDEADKDYCREVAAYLELDEKFGGKETPRYFGSWTFQLPLDLPDGQRLRDIRMILMERIKGHTMLDIQPAHFPEAVRLETLAKIMEALRRISFAGVRHRDISQRNIMLCDDESTRTIDRIVIIDFNYALVERLDNFIQRYGTRPDKGDKPENPVQTWWDGGFLYGGFGAWFPVGWEYRLKPLQEWLHGRWGKSPDFKPPKEPLQWDDDSTAQRYVQF